MGMFCLPLLCQIVILYFYFLSHWTDLLLDTKSRFLTRAVALEKCRAIAQVSCVSMQCDEGGSIFRYHNNSSEQRHVLGRGQLIWGNFQMSLAFSTHCQNSNVYCMLEKPIHIYSNLLCYSYEIIMMQDITPFGCHLQLMYKECFFSWKKRDYSVPCCQNNIQRVIQY